MSVTIPETSPTTNALAISVLQEKRAVFEALVDFRTIKDLNKKVSTLQKLQPQVEKLRMLCKELQRVAEQEVSALGWNDYVEKMRFKLLQYNFTLLGIGTIGARYLMATSTATELAYRIRKLQELHFRTTQASLLRSDTLDIFRYYKALNGLEPNNQVTRGLAEWLLQNEAYVQATTYFEALSLNQNEPELELYVIQALIGQRKFELAEQKIIDFKVKITKNPFSKNEAHLYFADYLKAECLACSGKYQEALALYHSLIERNPKLVDIQKKIIITTIRNEVASLKNRELTPLERKFFLANAKQMFIALDNPIEVRFGSNNLQIDLEFWLWALTANCSLYEDEALQQLVIQEMSDLVRSTRIDKRALINLLTKEFTRLESIYLQTTKSLRSFVMNTSETLNEEEKSIIEAQFQSLKRKVVGDPAAINDTIGIGITRKISVLEQVAKALKDTQEDRTICTEINLILTSLRNCKSGLDAYADTCKEHLLQYNPLAALPAPHVAS